ncbi:MAG: DNA internalization-related competence protein ComEC/Rec2 [Agarilytica sp.]
MLVVICAISALIGACFSLFSPMYDLVVNGEASNVYAVLLTLLAIFAIFVFKSLYLRAFVCALAGCLIASLQLQATLNQQLPLALENEKLLLVASIQSRPESRGGYTRFDVRVDAVESCISCSSLHLINIPLQDFSNRKVMLSWKIKRHNSMELKRGQKVLIRAKLRRPRGLSNPGGFDYAAWLLSKRYAARGYVLSIEPIDASRDAREKRNWLNINTEDVFHAALSNVEGFIETKLLQKNDLKQEAFIRALLLGDRSQVTKPHWNILKNTGTIHLLAISGLHVGLLAGFSFFLTRKVFLVFSLLSHYSRLQTITAMRTLPAVSSVFLSGAYVLISGMGVPAQRAWFGVVVFYIFYLGGHKINPLRLLLYIAVIVVFSNPLVLTQNGFWLSFTAVTIILATMGFRNHQPNIVAVNAKTQWVLLGLCLVLFSCGLPLAPLGVVANFIAVPAIACVILPCLFLATVFSLFSGVIAGALLQFGDTTLHVIVVLLKALDTLDLSLYFSVNSVWSFVCIAVFTILFLMPRAFHTRSVSVILLVLFLLSDHKPHDDRITVLDVGQGLAVVVESGKETLVYDTGARFSESFDIGSDVLAPFLRYRNIQNVESVVVSHDDNDHAGGLNGLANTIDIEALYFNGAQQTNRVGETSGCNIGLHFSVGAFNVTTLWPDASQDKTYSSNNQSCVLYIERPNFTAIFAGDIENDVENALLRRGSLPKDIDLLIAPHHGSNTSSSTAFLHRLRPKHVVFSTGYENRYRHPAKKVLSRYQTNTDAQLWNTAIHGAIELTFDKENGTRIASNRSKSSKPWE